MARALFLLAGVIMLVMAYVSYVFEIDLWFTRVRPFTILTVPFAGIGAIVLVYGLIAGRKIKAVKK